MATDGAKYQGIDITPVANTRKNLSFPSIAGNTHLVFNFDILLDFPFMSSLFTTNKLNYSDTYFDG